MAGNPTDPQEYVLVYDGESGLRMAPAGPRDDDLPEPRMDLGAGLRLQPSDPDPVSPAPRGGRRGLILAGSAGACLLALALALGAGLASRQGEPPSGPVEFGPRMKVVVAPERPVALAPAVKASERLEVLSPAALAVAPSPAAVSPSAEAPRLASAAPAPVRIMPVPAPPPREIASDPPAQSGGRQAAHCDAPRSRAEDVVCADPELLAADRRMARAFRAAARSGVDVRQLRDEQNDWLDIREDAAGRSPRAVAQIYDQRIEELEAMAADASPDR